MAKITRHIKVVDPNKLPSPIRYVQNTNVLPIEIIMDDYKTPSNSSLTLRVNFHRANGTDELNTSGIAHTPGTNVITVTPTGTFFAVPGRGYLQIQIMPSTTKELVTFRIPVIVEPNHIDGDSGSGTDRSDFIANAVNTYLLEDLGLTVNSSGLLCAVYEEA